MKQIGKKMQLNLLHSVLVIDISVLCRAPEHGEIVPIAIKRNG